MLCTINHGDCDAHVNVNRRQWKYFSPNVNVDVPTPNLSKTEKI